MIAYNRQTKLTSRLLDRVAVLRASTRFVLWSFVAVRKSIDPAIAENC
ncbi:hypothetical protein [Picosynechococcus sp. PCC 7003]|nr:hypothetical protein [Picosynechococcus sp. PCC 7003]